MGRLPFVCLQIVWCALLPGCGGQADGVIHDPSDIGQYASLPGLVASHHPNLRAEYQRLIAERATPELLDELRFRPTDSDSTPRESAFEGSATLDRIFSAASRRETTLRVDRIYPLGPFQFSRKRLDNAVKLNRDLSSVREKYRQLVRRPRLVFRIDHRQGLGSDVEFVELVQLGNRLVGLEAGELIEHGQLDEAAQRVEEMLLGAAALAKTDHVVPRIAAVHRRQEAFTVAIALCRHSMADAQLLERLLTFLDAQAVDWPDDATAWYGDRAAGLHTYELARAGYLLSLLDYEELREYREEIGIQELGALVARNLDEDESFYLNSMRAVILACEQPFYERRGLFHRIDRELEQRRESERYAFIADQLLLTDIAEGQRLQAVDRARLDAWRVALRTAIGQPGEVPINPLTGIPFIVDLRPTQVFVDAIDSVRQEPAIVLPVRRERHNSSPSAG